MNILILGDSTSFTGGYRPCSYPAVMARSNAWPEHTQIFNPSVAGLTSADAARLFASHKRKFGTPVAMVIYLGNCDSCATLYPKGRANLLGRRKAKKIRKTKGPRHLNPFRPYTFDPTYDQFLEAPEKPEDFEFNLNKIIKAASDSRIILIEPKANRYFIAGSGKGNFIFYRIFGVAAPVHDQLINLPKILALPFQEEADGNIDAAISHYREICAAATEDNISAEIKRIAGNNLAVLLAENGNIEEAVPVLDEMAASAIRREIILFNLHRFERSRGNHPRAEELMQSAFEEDKSIYRARAPYQKVVAALAQQYSNVELVDMAPFNGRGDYIDHCHLTEAKQAELAELVLAAIKPSITGGQAAKLNTCPVTPEYAFGEDRLLSDFLYARATGAGSPSNDINRIAEEAIGHPLFRDGADVASRPPELDAELGRFAEAYITRLLAPYLTAGESDTEFRYLMAALDPARLEQRLVLLPAPSRARIEAERQAHIPADPGRIELLKSAIVEDLYALIAAGPQMGTRYRTVMYRYFRESTRFGSHSRLSMLYDRLAAERIGEAILGVAVLAKAAKINEADWCRSAASLVGEIINALDQAAARWLNAYLEGNLRPTEYFDAGSGAFKIRAAQLEPHHRDEK